MGLLEYIKKKLGLLAKTSYSFGGLVANNKLQSLTTSETDSTIVDRTGWTGNDFEFLIVGDIDVFSDFDNIMTPNTLDWIKLIKNDWNYYKVGQDEYSYSIEEPGIQMTFNEEILFDKAKKIADEVITNINATGQVAELLILDSKKIYRFD